MNNCDERTEELYKCECCNELFVEDELTDTTEMINGGIGRVCEQCLEDNDIGSSDE